MSGTSSVGQSSVYEAGDQRNVKKSEIETADRYNEGKEHSHKGNDSSTWLKTFLQIFAERSCLGDVRLILTCLDRGRAFYCE